jgi:hypothetical protein
MYAILCVKVRKACFIKENRCFMKKIGHEPINQAILHYYLTVIIGGKEAASHAAFFVFTPC